MNKISFIRQDSILKASTLLSLYFLLACIFASTAYAQTVYRDTDGKLSIQMPDGTLRAVAPSDSILYRHAFENILPLPKEDQSDLEKKSSVSAITSASLLNERDISISLNIRAKENRITFLHQRINELDLKITELEEQLEFARANPGRIRPNERIELSNSYNSAVDERARSIREIPRLKDDLVIMKRQNHLDVLANLKLPKVSIISERYFLKRFTALEKKVTNEQRIEKSPEEVRWVAPGDIPMPIIPHPSSVEIRDVIENPPDRACNVFSSKTEKEIANFVIRTRTENLTFYLPAEMRIHRRGRPMLSIDSHIEVRHGGKFLVLDIYLKIPSARRSMGGVRMNTPIRIEMIDGQVLNLRALNEDSGTYYQELNEVHFRAVAPLSRMHYEILAETEIDKLRMRWDSGHQDYEIFDIRILMHQLKCIDQYISKN